MFSWSWPSIDVYLSSSPQLPVGFVTAVKPFFGDPTGAVPWGWRKKPSPKLFEATTTEVTPFSCHIAGFRRPGWFQHPNTCSKGNQDDSNSRWQVFLCVSEVIVWDIPWEDPTPAYWHMFFSWMNQHQNPGWPGLFQCWALLIGFTLALDFGGILF